MTDLWMKSIVESQPEMKKKQDPTTMNKLSVKDQLVVVAELVYRTEHLLVTNMNPLVKINLIGVVVALVLIAGLNSLISQSINQVGAKATEIGGVTTTSPNTGEAGMGLRVLGWGVGGTM